MYIYPKKYDVIVVGAGHAGCEAALASAKMGCETLLLTISLDTIAQMSCNPAIGGLAKGHLVREIDALGGAMAKVTDATGIQFRMLNRGKGPAVWAPRAQADKKAYHLKMKHLLEEAAALDLKQALVEDISIENGRVTGVITQTQTKFEGHAVIITTGTFLRGLIHVGLSQYEAGRAGEFPSKKLSDALERIGFELGRLKTGTPPRINKNTVDFSAFTEQPGDVPPPPFSFSTDTIEREQVPCYLGYTNERTHEVIRNNLDRSPLYSGKIVGIGPRYCPSIEDKVVKFPEKKQHQIFLEPEGIETDELYCNGIPSSLPEDVQLQFLRTIRGLEQAEIMRSGYAIEYDFAPPSQIKATMETRKVENLYFAGQINGTSGYEEAAAQGLMAGINAALKLRGDVPLVLDRSQAYIGVLLDDLVTKEIREPYRMFTARAEYRLLLRQDNADLRLMPIGHRLGLVDDAAFERLENKRERIEEELLRLRNNRLAPSETADRLLVERGTGPLKDGATLEQLLRRPELNIEDVYALAGLAVPEKNVAEQVQIEVKYDGYIKRQLAHIEKLKKLEDAAVPNEFDFSRLHGLSTEGREKLMRFRPASVGQAARISGVSPSDISILMIYLRK
ncbi:MAG: tRNA uridine-5-carboxymethylaminomethyl(34) synthesis enzyme MnmG [Candidatus Abyssobacteria bacterium SURF_17]|uniref:tRNA uridine 5-carboxymethylaminomethyl modification enzyme MnmG n=1 Tax=Candidatus Abyssobacteria bacterium SURF_17 TaxID=2093361 RepID=A0A419F8B6_9BACT|nr:MAG: tRNA uridine-5-carboxymethylaminomethyl(34) synthesis enzyme MnmG [Candidatus Abyssubacteria bacterium SURF_17]